MKTNRMQLVAGALLSAIVTLGPPSAAKAQVCPLPGQTGACQMANPWIPLDPALQPKFVQNLPVPVFYEPDQAAFPGQDYYEVGMQEVKQVGGPFPAPAGGCPPDSQWLGLVCPLGCTMVLCGCEAPLAPVPLCTPVWGYGQLNQNGGPIGQLLNDGIPAATYPAMSFKAFKDLPVKVKWVNSLTSNNHLFCPEPLNSDVPCAIDRTLMGTYLKPGESVNQYGTKMQPDNAMVVHLHGGEIPPDSDGFAELWIGNETTAAAYQTAPLWTAPSALHVRTGNRCSATVACPGGETCDTVNGVCVVPVADVSANVDPHFTPPFDTADPKGTSIPLDVDYPETLNYDGLAGIYQAAQLVRPTGNSIYYNYPMVQPAATIWYHDHTLGKTRINVAAGPAGYFYIQENGLDSYADPTRFGPGGSTIARGAMFDDGRLPEYGDCTNAGILAGECYDIPIVLQDRAFNGDGSINFPNGLGQAMPGVAGWNPLLPGPNPTIHPQWVPEYFGDMSVVNGVIWPKLAVEPRPYRFRLLDGSNARCYTLGLKVKGLTVQPNFIVIASDQGYLPTPAIVKNLDICPGERYDVVVDFSAIPFTAGVPRQVLLTNSAGAPFPNGEKPIRATPFAFLGELMRFDVGATANAFPVVAYPGTQPLITVPPVIASPPIPRPPAICDATFGLTACAPGVTKYREMVLNEVLDPITLAPVKVQIDGRPFEYPVTETPNRGTIEVWAFVNTTVDAHPIHLHLVQFQVLGRQKFNTRGYGRATGLANPVTGVPWTKLPVAGYLAGSAVGPLRTETGRKDTVIAYPGEVTYVAARWESAWPEAGSGAPLFWEPVTAGPYVWHCHIVDHEDNEMMRPSLVLPATANQPAKLPAGSPLIP